ncbi:MULTISPECIES: SH3 domain-containing protein [Streptomyces]|nr:MULTISPECIES: SH3 domain-containing protein [Streptomyces]MCM1944908.1 SH3 domain-containing protein [Streptomyces sp. G2]
MKMTTMLGVTLTAVFLAALAPAPAAPERLEPCGYEADGPVHLRTGPSASRRSLGVLGPGDRVTVEREAGDWYRISLDARSRSGLRPGTEGWTVKRHLEPRTCSRPSG